MNKSEIIERLKNIAEHAVHTVGERPFIMSLDDGIAVHEAIELLKKAETNCPEIPDSWVPVSKRLPTKELKKRISYAGKDAVLPCLVTVFGTVQIRYFDGEDFMDIYGDVCTDWVKAWMPLPEPWEGEADGKID